MSNEGKERYLCECNGACNKPVWLSAEERQAQYVDDPAWMDKYNVANDCPNGPLPGWAVVEKHDGYTIYKEEEKDE